MILSFAMNGRTLKSDLHATTKFSRQLEVDHLKRDIRTLEDALTHTRQDIAAREGNTRERDLTMCLGNQTQSRFYLSEELDTIQASLKAAESEVSRLRTKVHELEAWLAKDQKSLLSSESQYRDQLTERNTLLLTIYYYMDKTLGVDKPQRKAVKLIRVKEAEARPTEKLTDMRKQRDTRWKWIYKFETSVKAYNDVGATWRLKYVAKEGEAEALKVTDADLVQQLATTRHRATRKRYGRSCYAL